MSEIEIEVEKRPFRAGFVGIIGLPNVGKSTLMNKMIGEKVAIVSPRPQTTRNNITGIKSTPDYQAIFVDTPGFHTAKTRLNKVIVQQAIDSIGFVDVICVLCEADEKVGQDFARLVEMAKAAPQPKILVITKIDDSPRELVYKTAETVSKMCDFKQVIPISSVKNINIDKLIELVVDELPENVAQFDTELVTTQPEKFLIAEYIREQMFLNLRQEVPYDTLVEVEDMEVKPSMMKIHAVIYVNRESQKGILIGEGGLMMKKIGEKARMNLEAFFDTKINLQLWVKVKENWIAKDDFLEIQGLKG